MKANITFLACLLLFINFLAFSQKSNGVARIIHVKTDKNTILETGVDFCASKSDECYIVDGNESKGYIEMEFDGIQSSKNLQAVSLFVNCADVEYAESLNGFSVFWGSHKIGNISQINRNARAEIPLDASVLKSENKITITIKANGDDGLYLLSKKSGFGAFLMLSY